MSLCNITLPTFSFTLPTFSFVAPSLPVISIAFTIPCLLD